MAVLIAAELYSDFDITAVYTYGQPRVGNKKFAKFIDKNLDVFRVVINKDLISDVPPRNFPLSNVGGFLKALGVKTKSAVKTATNKVKEGVVKGANKVKEGVKKGANKVKNVFHFR